MNEMRTKVRRELVRHAAGRAIFCDACDGTLDARSTAVITWPGHGARTVCLECLTGERIGEVVAKGASIDAWNWTRGGYENA